MDQAAVRRFFEAERPDEVYLAAAKVGGILANNNYPAEFIYENLVIQTNVIESAFRAGVKKLLFLGSSCIYPRNSPQPIPEEALLNGTLESTNEPYAIAKISGLKLCESFNRQYGESRGIDYRSVMPTNLYGPGDNYHPENSHVVPALLRRFDLAKQNKSESVTLWGSGSARREFLHVDDMASGCCFVMQMEKRRYDSITAPTRSFVNIGFGKDISILELASIIAETIGYEGKIVLDRTKPDGTPRKLIDSQRLLSQGWKPKIALSEGLRNAYSDYLQNTK